MTQHAPRCVIIIPDTDPPIGGPVSMALADEVVARLTESGVKVLSIQRASSRSFTRALLEQDRQKATDAVTELDDQLGELPAIVGIGFGATTALRLAIEGVVDRAALFALDPLLDRTLQGTWDSRAGTHILGGEQVTIDDEMAPAVRSLLASCEDQRSAVPLLNIATTAMLPRLDTTWGADPSLPNETLGIPEPDNGPHAWSPARIAARMTTFLTAPLTPRSAPSASPDDLPHRRRVFISYTHRQDGPQRAERIDRYLNAAGIRTFRDVHDLGVGAIEPNIGRALRENSCGGVLVVTPELKDSTFVQEHELPELLQQAAIDGRRLAIDNALPQPGGRIDPNAPDHLLGLAHGELSKLTQFDLARPADMVQFLMGWLSYKLQPLTGEHITLDIQTYPLDQDIDEKGDVDLRIRGAVDMRAARVGHQAGNPALDAYALAFPLISEQLHAAKPSRIMIQGGAHFPLAIALGGVLMATRTQVPVVIKDKHGLWGDHDHDPGLHHVGVPHWTTSSTSKTGRIAVYVDLIGGDPARFEELVSGPPCPIDGALRITRAKGDPAGSLHPQEGLRLAQTIGGMIRKKAREQGATQILLCGCLNFPIAVLLGRELNTFDLAVFDLARATGPGPCDGTVTWYRRVLDVSGADGQIARVYSEPFEAPRTPVAPAMGAGPIKLVNLTPHDPLTYVRPDGSVQVLPREGTARCVEHTETDGFWDAASSLPRVRVGYGNVSDLPDPQPGTLYVVSQLVVAACPDRTDLAYPSGLLRDDPTNPGQITGFSRLAIPAT